MVGHRTETVKCSTLIRDYKVWPREKGKTKEIDRQNVHALIAAYKKEDPVPPIVADRKTRIVVDGFCRIQARMEMAEDSRDAEIEVEWRDYPDRESILEAATIINRTHGMRPTQQDLSYVYILAAKLRFTPERLANMLGKDVGTIKPFYERNTARNREGTVVALPGGARRLAQLKRPLNAAEENAVESSNMCPPQTNAYILIRQLKAPACCHFNEAFMALLKELGGLIEETLERETAGTNK